MGNEKNKQISLQMLQIINAFHKATNTYKT